MNSNNWVRMNKGVENLDDGCFTSIYTLPINCYIQIMNDIKKYQIKHRMHIFINDHTFHVISDVLINILQVYTISY